ncbi:hypothetical protein D9615_004579 [Tricholomella constricta]|uniref:Uncharacterized protein n=1 Tax=Tricholomella constricta TaxID=117010 RepID=A0A8H5HC53_9AGAR|nr:hypothetical protein D9615_004579 [Tricholomella constricta]
MLDVMNIELLHVKPELLRPGGCLYDILSNTMPLSPAPALLVGLGARILLDYFTRSGDASIRDFVLIGVWQGVGLHYASKITSLAIIVGFGISTKILVEFNLIHDITRTVTTLLGIALGVLCTECLSQFFGAPNGSSDPDRRRKKTTPVASGQSLRRERVVQFRTSGEGDASDARHTAFRETVHTVSDITSVDSSSEMIGPAAAMSPLDREIATLRTRASLADSERRRFKEERKWAVSQGNLARASQMKWQVKRYTALMQSFHREADIKLLEASGGRSRQSRAEEPRASSSKQPARHRREQSNGHSNGQTVRSPETIPTRRPSKQVPRDTMR